MIQFGVFRTTTDSHSKGSRLGRGSEAVSGCCTNWVGGTSVTDPGPVSGTCACGSPPSVTAMVVHLCIRVTFGSPELALSYFHSMLRGPHTGLYRSMVSIVSAQGVAFGLFLR